MKRAKQGTKQGRAGAMVDCSCDSGEVEEVNILYLRKGRATDKCSEIIVCNHDGKNSVFSKIKANIW